MSNIPNVKFIANKLADLKEQVVFVGGSIVELLLDKNHPIKPRMSDDVDTIIEIYTRNEFSKIEKKLRTLGFQHDISGSNEKSVICRFVIDGIKLDLMPTNPNILGFSNIWYEAAFQQAKHFSLEKNCEIRLITAPFLLATKLEAFLGRGKNDYYGSHDLEDIITLLDGRSEIVDEIRNVSQSLQDYLYQHFSKLMTDLDFINALPGHLAPYGIGANFRTERVLTQIKKICSIPD